MDLIKAMYARHAVRHYNGKPLNAKDKKQLQDFIKKINKENNLNIQLVTNEKKAFDGGKAARCNFTGCVNWIALIGPKSKNLDEKLGYWGEAIVLFAQAIGLNTCWVRSTYNDQPNKYKVKQGEELRCLISIGYGTTQGHQHESKKFSDVVRKPKKITYPKWFVKGVKYALLAPTGINQQGFTFSLKNDCIVKVKNNSFCKGLDLGIVKYHFELAAKAYEFKWAK